VPHAENISYFGNGSDEAQMVYNFPLPPLILHAFQNESAGALATWAAGLTLPSKHTTFFNFLASHDGIGLNPLRGILPEDEIELVVERAVAYGALVSYKETRQGEKKPYELNINYFDALNSPGGSDPIKLQVDRLIAAHTILLGMPGVPAIYFHSLLGTRGWPEGAAQTGRNRTINRQKFTMNEIEDLLLGDDSRQKQVFRRLCHLLNLRKEAEAFHPHASWKILNPHPAVLGILRKSPGANRSLLCLQNVSGKARQLDPKILKEIGGAGHAARDIISSQYVSANDPIRLQAYEGLWLESA
jgi:sucrose phosphorylase